MNKSEVNKLASYVDTLIHDFNSTPEMVSVGLSLLDMFPKIKDSVLEYKCITDIMNLQKCIVGCIRDHSTSLALVSELDRQIFKICTDYSSDFYDIISDYVETTGVDPIALAEIMANQGYLSSMSMKEVITSDEWIECCKWVICDDSVAYQFISGGFIGTQG